LPSRELTITGRVATVATREVAIALRCPKADLPVFTFSEQDSLAWEPFSFARAFPNKLRIRARIIEPAFTAGFVF
jgi:hypothetical protein